MERTQFTFYKSFADAISRIKKPADRCAAYDALVQYAFYEALPDFDKLPDTVALFFELAKPTLDTSRRKAESGKRGGTAEAKSKQEEAGSKPEANRKQTGSKKEKEKENENEREKEKEKEIENECSISPSSPSSRRDKEAEVVMAMLSGHSLSLRDITLEWLQYKREKKNTYQETGLRNLLKRISEAANTYGDDAVTEVIRKSMSMNYQGIVFDWLDKTPQTGQSKAAKELHDSFAMLEDWANDQS